MAVISAFSTDAFSTEETGDFLIPLLHWLFPGVTPATLDLMHAVARKAMHVIEFGILALLWYRALGWNGSGWQASAALAAFLLAAGFAAVDEAHQGFVSSRTGTFVDVGWDSLGAAAGLIGRWAIGRNGERENGRTGEPGNR
jgi:VanZ family protein